MHLQQFIPTVGKDTLVDSNFVSASIFRYLLIISVYRELIDIIRRNCRNNISI